MRFTFQTSSDDSDRNATRLRGVGHFIIEKNRPATFKYPSGSKAMTIPHAGDAVCTASVPAL